MNSRTILYGFTLVELMIALLVFSSLSMVAVPSFVEFQERQATSIKALEVKRMLEFARNIAITKNKEIKVCLATSDYRCTRKMVTDCCYFMIKIPIINGMNLNKNIGTSQ